MCSESPSQSRSRIAITVVFIGTIFIAQLSSAQTYTVLHSFTGGGDGANPYAGLVTDGAGNFYGMTDDDNSYGAHCDSGIGCGTVFKFTHLGSNWVLTTIYAFQGSSKGDGAYPTARVTLGADGALYGTTPWGGISNDGIVFLLTPPTSPCKTALCPWTETILHSFEGGDADGAHPGSGNVTFEPAGKLYGTTSEGGGGSCGSNGCGTAYQLSQSSGGWTESIIYDFSAGHGFDPDAGVTLDSLGNLYGTTMETGIGTVYELTPVQGGWLATTLFDFTNQPEFGPIGGLIFDHSGNLYGTTGYGGFGHGGTVFKLSPSSGGWSLALLFSFPYQGRDLPPGPTSTLVMDASGALYGTTYSVGVYGCGSVFKLTPSGNNWIYTSLHDFTCDYDGGHPFGQIVLDANGNIYGTTSMGGPFGVGCTQSFGCGVVWEITP